MPKERNESKDEFQARISHRMVQAALPLYESRRLTLKTRI